LKEKHAAELEELSHDLEASAVSKLTAASRRALEENTMLLRQVRDCRSIKRKLDIAPIP